MSIESDDFLRFSKGKTALIFKMDFTPGQFAQVNNRYAGLPEFTQVIAWREIPDTGKSDPLIELEYMGHRAAVHLSDLDFLEANINQGAKNGFHSR